VAGFDVEQSLALQLQETRFKDKQRGFTQRGAHRADLSFKTDMGLAELILSRGQKKVVSMCFKIGTSGFLQAKNKTCVVLIDDLASELDVLARERLLTALIELQAQVLSRRLKRIVFGRC
jgi:DNA replication and repair protein RecF